MIDIYKMHELKILLSEQEKTYLELNLKTQNLRRNFESEIESIARSIAAQAQKHSRIFKALEAIAQGNPSGPQPHPQPIAPPDKVQEAPGAGAIAICTKEN